MWIAQGRKSWCNKEEAYNQQWAEYGNDVYYIYPSFHAGTFLPVDYFVFGR